MALIPLNTFKTKTKYLTTSGNYTSWDGAAINTTTVYTAPIGVTSIVLMAQISNLSTTTQQVTFIHHRNRPVLADAQGNGAQTGNTDSMLVKNYAVPKNDAANVLSGKLILESLDSIRAYTNSTSTQTMQLVLSVLETANA